MLIPDHVRNVRELIAELLAAVGVVDFFGERYGHETNTRVLVEADLKFVENLLQTSVNALQTRVKQIKEEHNVRL